MALGVYRSKAEAVVTVLLELATRDRCLSDDSIRVVISFFANILEVEWDKGKMVQLDLPVIRSDGEPTDEYLHIQFQRLDTGLYESLLYVL